MFAKNHKGHYLAKGSLRALHVSWNPDYDGHDLDCW